MTQLDPTDISDTVGAELADLAALGSCVPRHQLDELTALVDSRSDRPLDRVELAFNGETLGVVPRCTPDDVTRAVERAREAQVSWARRPMRERAGVALRFHDLVLARRPRDPRHRAARVGQGSPPRVRRGAGRGRRGPLLRARPPARTCRQRRRRGALPLLTSVVEHHHPKGVVGIIAPWNYPFTLGLSDALPALLAGNGVVIKPDAQTPYSSLWGCALLEEAGLPRGARCRW